MVGLVRIGKGIRTRIADAGGSTFDPLTLGPFAWWRVVPGNIWQDTAGTVAATADGDPVGRVDDMSGSGLHLLQSTAAARPVLRTSAGKYWLEFDGVDDRLRVTFTSTAQPITRITSVNQVTWAANDRLWDGGAVNQSGVWQSGSSPNLVAANSVGSSLVGEVLNDWMVITERMYGAGTLSSHAVDNNSYTTQSAGWAGTAQTGFTVGSIGDGSSSFSNILWAGTFIEDGTLTDPQIASLRTYLAADVGKTL